MAMDEKSQSNAPVGHMSMWSPAAMAAHGEANFQRLVSFEPTRYRVETLRKGCSLSTRKPPGPAVAASPFRARGRHDGE